MKFYVTRPYQYGKDVLDAYLQLKKYNVILKDFDPDDSYDTEKECIIEINNLDELLDLRDDINHSIIIHDYDIHDIKYMLEIYDDYIE